MMPTVNAPPIDRKGESFSNYALDVELWYRVTNLEPLRKASAGILDMDPVAS